MITVREVLSHLKGVKRQGKKWQALCPAHEDSKASLSISESEGGKVLTHCHAGCTPENVWAALHVESNGNGKREIAAYDYRSGEDNLLYQSVRYEPKDFRQRRPNGMGGWDWKLNGTPRVLYRLPELLAADSSQTVLIVEGEKDCDRLAGLGQVATTNAGGAGKWCSEYNRHLAGRRIVILPDNDEPGRKHAQYIAESLSTSNFGIAASVKIVELPGLAEKADVSDWLDAGGTVSDLESLVLNAQEYRASAAITPRQVSDSFDYQVPWPVLGPAAMYGLAGDIARTIEPHSESDPIALLVQTFVAYGNVIGRSAYFVAEADWHHTNLYTVLIGISSKGRKGTSLGHVRKLFARVDENWSANCLYNGLSSGEGLIHVVRDPSEKKEPVKDKGKVVSYQTVVVDHGVDDKRALVIEPEFASVLRVMARDGSTLSAILRQGWDGGKLRVMSRNTAAMATGALISIIGHVTGDELTRNLDQTEQANGFANRFLWLCVRRSKFLPEGGSLADSDLNPLVERLNQAVKFGRNVREIKRAPEAAALWRDVYPQLSEGHPGMLGVLTSRAEAQTMRLACMYALLDCSHVIQRVHLEAALALWQYCEDSARYIFGDALGDKLADEILGALREASETGLTRSQIRDLFRRNVDADRIAGALKCLAENGLAHTRKEPSEGRPIERWLAAPRTTAAPKPCAVEPEQVSTREEIYFPPGVDPDEVLEREAIRAEGCG